MHINYICRNQKYKVYLSNLIDKVMNCDTIGANAGAIWQALNEAEAMGIKQIKKVTKLKDKEVFAAIGWLAREGKLMIDVDPEDPKELILTLERN